MSLVGNLVECWLNQASQKQSNKQTIINNTSTFFHLNHCRQKTDVIKGRIAYVPAADAWSLCPMKDDKTR